MKKFILFFIFCLPIALWGQTSLSPGELVVLNTNGDGDDGFSFMSLVDLDAGTTVHFTDVGWRISTGAFKTTNDGGTGPEDVLGVYGVCTYTVPGGGLSAGVVVSQDKTNSNGNFSSYPGKCNFPYIPSLGISYGDQVIVFQGTFESPTFIWALSYVNRTDDGFIHDWTTDGSGDASGLDDGNSDLPAGLTDGTNAIVIPHTEAVDYDNGWYSGTTTSADADTWRSRVVNPSNWTYTDDLVDGEGDPDFYTHSGQSYTVESSLAVPTATTDAASAVSTTGASLNGTVNANSASTAVTFEYGLTTGYGTTVPADQSPVTGTSDILVSKSISGLSPNTTYHYRVVGVNSEGTTNGLDANFTTLPLAATITTQAVTSITQTTATGNGNITDLGDPNPTQHGVCWNTGGTPTIADSKTEEGAVSATGAFTSNITSLSAGTMYYVRAYVTNAAGTVYGSEVNFTALEAPTVTTQAITSITTTTATGNGNVTDLGVPNPTQHGVCWSTSTSPTTSNSKTEEGAVSAIGAFTSDIIGLSPGTMYYVRAYATNSVGTIYGSEVSFTALEVPTVTTQAVTSIATSTATANGNVTDLGVPNPTQHGVCWSTSTNPTTSDSKTEDGAVSAIGAFTGNITGLSPGTMYYVRAYATNSVGTVYGSEVSFTTLKLAGVTTQAVTNITSTTLTANGTITDLGIPNPTAYGVCMNTSGAPSLANYFTDKGAASATGSFTSDITLMTSNTTYYVRAYATNEAGTTYGTEVSFTTEPEAATVTTQAVTNITQTTATANGNVTDLGVPNPTEHGVCWSTSNSPTTSDSKTAEGAVSVIEAFTSDITGLSPGTMYYVRAYATNLAGTVYGSEVSFTSFKVPTVTTQAVTSIATTTATANGNITDLGIPNPIQHGVCWNTGGTPMLTDSKTEDGAVSGTGAFTSDLTSLSAGTMYYVRAYAINAAGTVYGSEVSFTTLKLAGVTTEAITNITSTTFTANGTITDLGIPNPTAYGICLNTSGSPTLANFVTDKGAASATGAFTSDITSLVPNTTYYVRAYATNEAGTIYGADMSCTTALEVATVTTNAASSLTAKTTTLNGTVNANNASTDVTFEYGLTEAYGTILTADQSPITGMSDTGVSVDLTGLTPSTTYHYRVVGVNAGGTSNGSDLTFTTLSQDPIVTTNAASDIESSGATLNGTVNANDLSTTVTFEYGLTETYGSTVTADQSPVTGTTSKDVSVSITDLIPNATYHFRVVGVNSEATTNGSDVTFTTLSQDPIATTNVASDIEPTGAILNGTVNANNYSTTVTFEYGLTIDYGTTLTADQSPVTGTSDIDVSVDLTGLIPSTTYHYRVVGLNVSGTSNGYDMTFTTNKYDQVITFAALSDKTTADADFDPGATSNLDLDITYMSSNEQVATIVSNMIHVVGVGIADITASQVGNDTVNAATPVMQSLNVTQATGFENTDFIDFKIFPNPAKDYVSIDIGSHADLDVKISIIDLSGRIIYTEDLKNTINTIDMSNYSSGIYFVKIETPQGSKKRKLILE
ncbi:MAG: T9SS type A sorting domain-containing protein [Bacteroidales bacterium]|nr:T9SS type A sorting domain-containing protein [Bacteroidales bacterium]